MSKEIYKNTLEPAHSVICKLGGVRSTARILGLSPSSVSRWMTGAAKNGTNGAIPQKHWKTILNYAKQEQLKISISDLLYIA